MKLPIFATNLQKIHYGSRLRPARDWLVLISVATVLLIISAVGNALEFKKIIANQVSIPAVSPHSDVVNVTALGHVQEIFAARASERTRYETGVYSFTDPSK